MGEYAGNDKDLEDARNLAMRACGWKQRKAKALVKSCIQDASEILQENDANIERIANALLSKGSLNEAEVKKLMEIY